MSLSKTTRRGLISGLAALLGGFAWFRFAQGSGITPGAAEGPFYPAPDMRRADIDNDLVKIAGRVEEAGGEIVHVKGQLMTGDGAPLAGRRVEIWQCDVNGKYLHPGDDRTVPSDEAFQGFGHDITDDSGRYRFRTIRPTPYPGRTPHIHVKVLDGERELLTTQFYIDGHPDNARDSLYRRMSEDQAKSVSMTFRDGPDAPEAIVDIVV